MADNKMHYFIKNMVCNRCIMAVQQVFEGLGYNAFRIVLGEVETSKPVVEIDELRKQLLTYGFELIDDSKSRTIEKIKNTIVTLVHHGNHAIKVNYSEYISAQLNRDYSYLSSLFSEVEGTTIEKYIIHQKIEKVKELLVYDELTLTEIAHNMGYSSVAYLSGQFKKVTGLTISHFRQVKENKRKPLDKI